MKSAAEYYLRSAEINGEALGEGGGVVGPDVMAADRAVNQHQLNKLKIAAEENARNYTTFLANMGHELRSPLNAIIGFSELLTLEADGGLSPETAAMYGRYINDSGKALQTHIDDMLRISKVNSERLALQECQVNVDRLIDHLELMIRDRADRARIHYAVFTPSKEWFVWADERRLSQALLNILSNAVKFTPEGGSVTLTVKHDKARGLSFHIRNTGMQMRREDIQKGLTEFAEFALKMDEEHKASGTGFPLSKRLIELHGGVLEIESDPTSGTCVIARMPPERVITAVR